MLWVLLAMVAFTVACGGSLKTRRFFAGDVKVTIDIAENANQNSGVAVDVLIVSDEKTLAKLIEMPAKEWFEQRQQFLRDHGQSPNVDYWGWEWEPGQVVPPQTISPTYSALGTVIFANYATPGNHRFRVDPYANLIIRLMEKDFAVETKD